MGKGLAVLTFSPSIKIKAGVWYLDRVVVKILPAGGICWTPNPDVYFDILFPNPKIGKRLTTWGNTDWWIYCLGRLRRRHVADHARDARPSSRRSPTCSTTTTFASPWAWSSTR